MDNFDLGEVGQLDDLREQLKRRGNHCLTRNYSGQNCHDKTRIKHSWWSRVEEWIREGAWIVTDVCSLADILSKVNIPKNAGEHHQNSLLVEDRDMQSKATIFELHCGEIRRRIASYSDLDYLLVKAPRSANSASTPVKASKMPPRDLQPSVLFRII